MPMIKCVERCVGTELSSAPASLRPCDAAGTAVCLNR